MDMNAWVTPLVVLGAGVAWWPGVAPTPYVVPEQGVEVPPWIEAEDCVREDRLDALPIQVVPGELRQVVACRRHRPGGVDGTLHRFEVLRSGLAHGGQDALDAWVLTLGMREGDLLEQAVGLTLEREALQRVDGVPSEQLHWAAGQRAPLSVAGEGHAMRALAAECLQRGMPIHWVVARSDADQVDRHATALDDAFAAPPEQREVRVGAALAGRSTVGWSWWATEGGRAAAWRARSAGVVRDLAHQDVQAEEAVADLLRSCSGEHGCDGAGRFQHDVVPHVRHHHPRHRR